MAGLLAGLVWPRTRWLAIAALAASLLSLGACCGWPDFTLPKLKLRLDFAFDLALTFRFQLRVRFNGDYAAWARVRAAGSATLDLDGELPDYELELDVDIDDDGVPERVRALAFGVDPARPRRLLLTYAGDETSFDAGRCYVLQLNGSTRTVLSAPCDADEPALSCLAPPDGALQCSVCDAAGKCAACAEDTVDGCTTSGREALEAQGLTEARSLAELAAALGGRSGTSVDARSLAELAASLGGRTGASVDARSLAELAASLGGRPGTSVDARSLAELAASLGAAGTGGAGGTPATGGAGTGALSECDALLPALTADATSCGLSVPFSAVCESSSANVVACAGALPLAKQLGALCTTLAAPPCSEVLQ